MANPLVHDGDPVLRSHVLAAVAVETERGRRISKRKSRARIDGAVAAALAVHGAVELGRPEPVRYFEVLD